MLRSWIYLMSIGILFLGLYIFTSAYIALLTLFVIALLALSSAAVVLFARRNIRLTLTSGWPTYKGEEGTIQVKLENKGFFPITNSKCELTFYNRLTKYQTSKNVFLRIKGKGEVVVPLHFTSGQIGKIEIRVKKVRVYDYLHLFSLPVSTNTKDETYIIPHKIPIEIIEEQKPSGADSGMEQPNNKKVRLGADTIGMKEYEAGDSVKDIHWKLTSKFQFPIIKEYSEAVDKQILLFYDAFLTENPQEINTRMEVFLSVSEALFERGYEHTLGWNAEGSRDVQLKDIHTHEDLVSIQSIILEIEHQRHDDKPIYETIYSIASSYSHTYMVTSERNQHLQDFYESDYVTVLAHSEGTGTYQEKHDDHVAFSSDTMQEDLRYLTV